MTDNSAIAPSSTTKRRVLMTDHPWPEVEIERAILAQVPVELIVAERTDVSSLSAAAADVDAIMTCWAKVPEAVMTASGRCRVVARMGIGLDNIDVCAATRHSILVTNVPDYCIEEVAEHALALLLALARKVAFYHHQTKSGRYAINAGPSLRRIAGKTLGIVGLGRIGRKLAAKSLGLGLQVVAYDANRGPSMPDVAWCELDELLAVSDYISLHAPLTPATQHLIGPAQLARMKSTAYLINTARGGLIDGAALAVALQCNRLAGAALDVQDPEPPDLSQPPFNDPRVIVTPHASFVSEESLESLRTRVARQVADVLSGRRPENVVNSELVDQ
jgi:D-3-phosphoglycerate dehydrogenase / 2-oxoglutarate reductase